MENNTKPFYNTTIPDDWELKKISEICDFIFPDRNKPEFSTDGIP